MLAARTRRTKMLRVVPAGLLFGAVLWVYAEEPAVPPLDPDRVIADALAAAVEIPKQAWALAELAWPPVGGNPVVAARARRELVAFGEDGIPALRKAVRWVRSDQQADVVRALTEAFRNVPKGLPADYLKGLDEATWFGSEDARRLAIPELARLRHQPSILTIMDSAYEFPNLLPVCIDALGTIGDERARFFLERQLNEGKPQISVAAAAALARIGGSALLPLKAALRSSDRSIRQNAADALVPVAGTDELSALNEYFATFPKDDPGTLQRVREATVMLEKRLEAQRAADAASRGDL